MKPTDLSLIKEYPVYVFSNKMVEICAPLFGNFPVSYFSYIRKYPDNSLVKLTTNGEWARHYYQKKYPSLINGEKIHTWLSIMPSQALNEAASIFNNHNGVIVEKRWTEDYIEVVEFASPNKYSDPIEFCTNAELLNKFILYFKEKACELLKIAEKEPIYFSKDMFCKLDKSQGQQNPHYTKFCREISVDKARFKFAAKNIVFTWREFEVLSQLAKGKTMKEIATMLKVSPRTVEVHLYNAKNKTNYFTMSGLVDAFVENLF